MPPRRELAPGLATMYMIYQFNKLRPPKFQGGIDPLRYEEWMRRLENLFAIMDCPTRFHVALGTYQFKGEVVYWKETVKPRRDESLITWERLKELMDTKYYPKDAKRAKSKTF